MSTRRLGTAYTVSTNRWLLERYAYVEERLFATLAGWIWDTPALEQKVELGRLSYEDAHHADSLRRRVGELFPPSVEPLRPQSVLELERFCNEVANARDPVERFVGMFRVAKPALLAMYRQHLDETDDITDWPTSSALRRLIVEEEEHRAWGERALDEMIGDQAATGRAVAWEQHLRCALEAIGGLRDRRPLVSAPHYRDAATPTRPTYTFPARDDRYHVVPIAEFQTPRPDDGPNAVVRLALYTNCNGELAAEEILGRVLAYATDLPWDMRLDLARQLWDEARHADMSWRRMEELGGPPHPAPSVAFLWPLYAGDVTDPLEDLIVLQRAAEGRAAEAHRARVVTIGKELGDPQTARLYEYIVADERSHTGYSDWIIRVAGNDPARVARLGEVQSRAEAAIASYFKQRADATAGLARSTA